MLAEIDSNKQNLHNYLKYTYKSNELALLIKYLKVYFKVNEKKNLKLFDLNLNSHKNFSINLKKAKDSRNKSMRTRILSGETKQ